MEIYLKIAHRARWLGEWVGDLSVWGERQMRSFLYLPGLYPGKLSSIKWVWGERSQPTGCKKNLI
ncbi:MAG: hypothetical protein D6728_14405 [Cyanobacteria bacterium J055]|nr:MAG: hypothetical protein D6728_14405 [Cyanobacteria bacterium J055]